MANYYVASCMFTAQFPEISLKILKYIESKENINIVRCCIPNYQVEKNSQRINNSKVKEFWETLPVSTVFKPGDTVIAVCPNCINIVEEWRTEVNVISLWEMIDKDPDFLFPNYKGLETTIQDCWRTRERVNEQNAVRSLLDKMNIKYKEVDENRNSTNFCGSTLYRKQPLKNKKLAPKHYASNAKDKFIEHTKEQQIEIMKEYCQQFTTQTVICYCHYCLEGLLQGGVDGKHIAELLFK